MTSKTELLLPVGNIDMCLAAIHNGADAIYMGVSGFNARGRSEMLDIERAKEIIDLCHLYGVRVNLAFNVVIFENELEKALQKLLDYLPLKPDAFIVQDLGLARLIRTLAPDQPVHASTQMTMTSYEGIGLLDDLGIKRFVLGRENSLSEIKLIRENTDKELEVFVHGALCVAYSGQCFTSESIGGRSANRGQCAQSCRLGYEMFVDGERKDLGDKKYLVSPQDLCGIEEAKELADMGVDSLKIEGRLKTPEYVAAAAKSYSSKLLGKEYDPSELSLTYSRGFYSGWLHGVEHQKLVPGDFSSHRGIELGEVIQVKAQVITIQTDIELSAGQGLLFVGNGDSAGGRIFKVLSRRKNIIEVSMVKAAELYKVKKGMKASLNSDPKVEERLSKSYKDQNQFKRIPIQVNVEVKGNEVILQATDGVNTVTVDSDKVERPLKRETTGEHIKEELGKLGRSCFYLDNFTFKSREAFYFSQKEMKSLRRSMTDAMVAVRINRKERSICLSEARELLDSSIKGSETVSENKLVVLVRNIEQLDALNSVDITKLQSVVLDYEFGKDYKDSIALLKEKGIKAGIATTRIHKPKEYYNLNMIVRQSPDFILVRNLGALAYLQDKGIELKADFSLNVTNHLSFNYLLNKNVTSIAASFDLNQAQLKDLMNKVDASKLEVVMHQYMPEFHMEHCVFAAFLSKGSSFKDCGKPCEKHKVELKDVYGQYHYLKADQECRNTFFRATPQSAGFMLSELNGAGVGSLRLEALYESPEQLAQKVNLYFDLLEGNQSYESTKKKLGASEKYGVFEGQL